MIGIGSQADTPILGPAVEPLYVAVLAKALAESFDIYFWSLLGP
jgi:hypothetical protein